MEHDGFPQQICTECFERLKIAHEFIRQTLESDKILKGSLVVKEEPDQELFLHEDQIEIKMEEETK